MSSRGSDSGPGGSETYASVADVLGLIGKAVFGAMLEDWTAKSLESYQEASQGVSVRELPDDSIAGGSALQLGLMQQLAGAEYSLEEISGGVMGFLALVVSGHRVLEEETVFSRVVWVSRREVAEPLFFSKPAG